MFPVKQEITVNDIARPAENFVCFPKFTFLSSINILCLFLFYPKRKFWPYFNYLFFIITYIWPVSSYVFRYYLKYFRKIPFHI